MLIFALSYNFNGSIIIHHDVLLKFANSKNASKEYETVLEVIREALKNCTDSIPDNNCPSYQMDPNSILVEETRFDRDGACKHMALDGFAQYYTYYNISESQFGCISVCDQRHTDHISCNSGQCTLRKSGPTCYCPTSDTHWYIDSTCYLKVNKAGFYAGLSVTGVVLLLAVIALLIYHHRYKRHIEKRERDSKEDLVNQWFEEEFEWSTSLAGVSSDTITCTGYKNIESSYKQDFHLNFENINCQMQMKAERPHIMYASEI
ncbi:UNVERIFIED_CONTAM: hypothetical protein FKN15_068757 [Acipenser sinensis]